MASTQKVLREYKICIKKGKVDRKRTPEHKIGATQKNERNSNHPEKRVGGEGGKPVSSVHFLTKQPGS